MQGWLRPTLGELISPHNIYYKIGIDTTRTKQTRSNAMPPAARISDLHTCPMSTGTVPHIGGPVAAGCPAVMIGFMPAARVGDLCICVGPPDSIAKGSATVMIGNMPAARMGDSTAHGGVIVAGCPTVIIGG
jgi:uncharacterized Zn-binding protein involved in type VI secretion